MIAYLKKFSPVKVARLITNRPTTQNGLPNDREPFVHIVKPPWSMRRAAIRSPTRYPTATRSGDRCRHRCAAATA